MPRPFKIKEHESIPPCPECGNKTEFVCHSQQVAEDYCEVWCKCKCGYDATAENTNNRIEDVWGGCSDENCLDAVNITWRDVILERV